jgi:hypothetical protein
MEIAASDIVVTKHRPVTRADHASRCGRMALVAHSSCRAVADSDGIGLSYIWRWVFPSSVRDCDSASPHMTWIKALCECYYNDKF